MRPRLKPARCFGGERMRGGELDPHIEKYPSGGDEVLIFTVASGNAERPCYGESAAKHSLLK